MKFKVRKIKYIKSFIIFVALFLVYIVLDFGLVYFFNKNPILYIKTNEKNETIYKSLVYNLHYCKFGDNYKIISKFTSFSCPTIEESFNEGIFKNSVGTIITEEAYQELIKEYSDVDINKMTFEDVRIKTKDPIVVISSSDGITIGVSLIDPQKAEKCIFGTDESGNRIETLYLNGKCSYNKTVCDEILKINRVDIYEKNCN